MADRWIRFDQGTDPGISKNLSLLAITAEEGISNLPRYELSVEIANEAGFVFYSMAGRTVAVRWSPDNDPQHDRVFEGIVVDVKDIEAAAVPTIRLVLRPWLWLLTQNVECRIYQDVTAIHIIEDLIRNQLANKIRSGNYRFDVSGIKGTYAERNYCVQYNESDFAFLSRILEDEGIYYYYGPDGILYFADDSTTAPSLGRFFPPKSESEPADNLPPEPAFNTAAGPIRRWQRSQSYMTANYEVSDVHCQAPADAHVRVQEWKSQLLLNGTAVGLPRITRLVAREASSGFAKLIDVVSRSGSADAEAFSPVGQQVRELADQIAKRRAEEAGCAAYRIEGSGDYSFFYPGISFQPTELLSKGISGSFLLLQVRHEIGTASIRSSDPTAGARQYSNTFVCMPRNVAFRPPRTTPKPKIMGTQTALVVGLTEDATTCADVLGRILVEFYWTKSTRSAAARLKLHDPMHCSAWVRWMQPWAGNNFGVQSLPRVGHEVVVAFQDGDPDQPIAVGSVSNATNLPAFPPKEQPNVSGIKTHSIGGDSNAFNGLRFDDTLGKEVTQWRGQRELLVDARQNVALSAGNSLVELASRHVAIVGEQVNLVGIGGQDSSNSDHWKNELAAVFPGNWMPVAQPPKPSLQTRINATYGYNFDLSSEFALRCTGLRHDVSGADIPLLYGFLKVVGAAATKAAAVAAVFGVMNTVWRTIGQGLGRLDYNAAPRTSVDEGFSLALYRGGRYEFVGAKEWPLFGPASAVIMVGWIVYSITTVIIPGILIERMPSKAAKIAKVCAQIARGLAFIILNCERTLAGLTAAKRLATSGVEVGKAVQKELTSGSFSFKHAFNAARKLEHAVSKIAGDLNDGNSFQEILGGHYLHAGKDIGIQAETGLSLESPSIVAKGDEISLHAGGSTLILGDVLSPVSLSSGLFSLKHNLYQGLVLKVGELGSISIDPFGKVKIQGLQIELEAAKIALQSGGNSLTIDPVEIAADGVIIKNQALLSIENACPTQTHSPI